MKATNIHVALLALLCTVFAHAQAVRPIVIDLATQKSGVTIKEELSETTVLQLSVINMLPSVGHVNYEITAVLSDEFGGDPIPVIDYIPAKVDPAKLRSGDSDECSKAYNAALDYLLHQAKEINVPGALSDAESQLDETCGSGAAGLDQKLEELTTAQDVMIRMLEYGKKMTIIVKRNGMSWRYELTVANKKAFFFYYGLSFSPNRMTPVPTFYCQSLDTTNTFVITRRRQETSWSYRDAMPTIFYTWVPRTVFHLLPKNVRRRMTFGARVRNIFGLMLSNNIYRIGLTGGLHTNFLKPKVMFSPSIVIGKNLTLNAGICFMQKSTLRGEYHEGQVVKEYLDFDALHENVY